MADGILDNDNAWSNIDVGQRSATGTNREQLFDAIAVTDPTETPLLSGLTKIGVSSTEPMWLLDSLASFGDPDVGDADVSVTPEGMDVQFSALSNRKRIGNLTHILRKTLDVTDTQRAVHTAGMEDEFLYQLHKAVLEWARDAEFAIVHSRRNAQAQIGNVAGTPAEGRKMEGILWYLEPDPSGVSTDYLSSNQEGTITECGSPFAQLTEAIYNDHCQAAYAKGIRFRTAYANYVQKREISAFTGGQTRNIEAADKRLIANIDVYESDFGLQAVLLNRYIPIREVLTLDEQYWKIGVLRPPLATELAKVGNTTRAMIEGEITLVAQAPATGGKIIWASAAFDETV